MIAAVPLTTDSLPVNWFDATILVVLGVGLFRGRKNGMTKEILPTLQWVITVIASGLAYGLVAQFYINSCGLLQHKILATVLGYLTIAIVVFLIFSGIKHSLNKRLEGSSIFGNAEYYLGMPSGMIRYFCILLFILALVNSRYYTAAEIAQKKAYNERWYGGGMYSGDYIPDLHNVQEAVFKNSFSGPYLKDYLGMVLIENDPDGVGNHTTQQATKQQQPVIHMGN